MLIVSDTSPIRALNAIGQIELLPKLYREIVIPPVVERELANPPPSLCSVVVSAHSFISVRTPSTIIADVAHLDPGEAEAISLAVELRPELLLIDERAGYAVAKQLGIPVTGLLGVLLDAKGVGLLQRIEPLLDQLRDDARFFISDSVRQRVLQATGE